MTWQVKKYTFIKISLKIKLFNVISTNTYRTKLSKIATADDNAAQQILSTKNTANYNLV